MTSEIKNLEYWKNKILNGLSREEWAIKNWKEYLIKIEERKDDQCKKLYESLLDFLLNPHSNPDYHEMILNWIDKEIDMWAKWYISLEENKENS